ncbi:MAG: globin family protein [Ilumatobacter sp.]
MTDKQIELVQTSYAQVEPIAEQAAALFYGRLFDIAPEVRSMFGDDMDEQGRKLMATLGLVVRGLNDLDSIVPAAKRLGERHVDYGVTDDQYPIVGEALLWTLAAGLGDAFTDEVAAAWAGAYGLLSGVMTSATENA